MLRGKFTSLLLIALLLSISACKTSPPEKIYQDSVFVFGTVVNITLADVDAKTSEKIFAQLEEDFRRMHYIWHAWQKGPIMRTNQLCAAVGTFTSAASSTDIINKAKRLAIASDHLFNPAIGKLVKLWGFQKDDYDDNFPPDDEDIQKLVASNPTLEDMDIKGVRYTCKNGDIRIDLGGIAKGYALETASAEVIKQFKVNNILINAGGDIKAIGNKGHDASGAVIPWQIGIRDPFAKTKDSTIGSIAINDNISVFTSGNYERYYEAEGKRIHHIIDPRTGYPAQGTASVTVLHEDATTADAAATALFVAGENDFIRIARQMQIDKVLLISSEGRYYISEEMEKMVKFKKQPDKLVVVKL